MDDSGVRLGFMCLRQILKQYSLLTMQRRTQRTAMGLTLKPKEVQSVIILNTRTTITVSQAFTQVHEKFNRYRTEPCTHKDGATVLGTCGHYVPMQIADRRPRLGSLVVVTAT